MKGCRRLGLDYYHHRPKHWSLKGATLNKREEKKNPEGISSIKRTVYSPALSHIFPLLAGFCSKDTNPVPNCHGVEVLEWKTQNHLDTLEAGRCI